MGKTWSVGFITVSEEEVKIALANGFDRRLVYNRIKNLGLSVEEAITRPKGIRVSVKGGYTQEDIKQAEANGISRATFNTRVHMLEWDLERAKTEKVGTSSNKTKKQGGF